MQIYNYISKTFIIMAFSMLCSFLGTIFLANQVSLETFGLLSLLKSLFPMCSMILLMGFDKSYIKNFSTLRIKKVARFIFPIIFFGGILTSLLFTRAYNLVDHFLPIYLCIVFGAINLFLSAYARLKNYYAIGQFIQSGHKIVFFILIVFYMYIDQISSNELITIYTLSLFVPSLYIIKYLRIEFSSNLSASYTDFSSMYKRGLLFFCVNILNLLIVNLERLVIPLMYGNEQLGIYTALTFVYITVFTMIGTSIGYVLFPELSKNNRVNYYKLIKISTLIIIILSFGFYCFGAAFNSTIYNSSFESFRTIQIDIMIICIGALQFINGLMHWFILGVGNRESIIAYLKVVIFTLFIYMLTIFLLIIGFNIDFINIIPTVLFGWTLKIFFTIIFIAKNNLIRD